MSLVLDMMMWYCGYNGDRYYAMDTKALSEPHMTPGLK